MLEELGTPLDKVVALDADHDVLMQRIAKRAQEQGRSDDTPEAIAKRLATYAKKPLRCSTRTRAAASWSPLTASATSTPFRPTSSPR